VSEQDKKNANDSEILIEKVRELEAAKRSHDEEEAERLKQRRNTARILGEKIHLSPPMSDDEARKTMGKYSRRSFLIGGVAALAGAGTLYWMHQPEQQSIWDRIFNRTFKLNEDLAQAYYSPKNLAPEFPKERIGQLRVNGGEGMSEGFDPETWKLQVLGVADQRNFPQFVEDVAYETAVRKTDAPPAPQEDKKGARKPEAAPTPTPAPQEKTPGLLLTMDDIRALPRVEMITELKCIEGWSVITHWAGARFSDLAAKFAAAGFRYVSLVTPDGGYYVGMDMPTMLHPQTLLCYEMNFAPLAIEHGAPLRLVTTMKYGIKQIKRIGRIEFTNERPKDFWAESGYDWYSGH
jgi:hypothetical protein